MSESDRELLELAAKAAGIEKIQIGDDDTAWISIPSEMEAEQYQLVFWNPLTDDGDALRLAVKLGFGVHQNDSRTLVCVSVFSGYGLSPNYFMEQISNDANVATRRAIVRAAAAIGKSTE